MNEHFIAKCNVLFENNCKKEKIVEELIKIQHSFEIEISEEYKYILENYAGICLKDNYGFKSLERTPLTDKKGYDSMMLFFPVTGKNNICEMYEVYKQQLPYNLIPIGELDGGNLLCINRLNYAIYIWIHDDIKEGVYLAQNSIVELIESFELLESTENLDLGIVETRFSASFLDALKNYKK